jgi:hypothetical protein
MAKNERRCENCEFYEIDSSDEGIGRCHFNAPLPSPKNPMLDEKFYKTTSVHWPLVPPSDWCGQYKAGQKQ